MWSYSKVSGRPLWDNLDSSRDLPHTIVMLINLRQQYDSYREIPGGIPEEYWDYPHLCQAAIERVYPKKGHRKSGTLDIPNEDLE